MQPLRYRIIYGYGSTDYIAIPESELERAQYAWIKNAIYTYGSKQRSGAEFKGIEEDYRYYTGWFDSYTPKESADYLQIKRDMPDVALFQQRLNLAKQRVYFAIKAGKVELLEDPSKIDMLMLN